ncbi:F420H2:quinone oxidoreductase, partial [gut metagenome]
CPSKGGSSQSDLTIADFWGIEQVKPAFDDDRGTSLIIVHSQHGEEVIKALDMKAEEVSHEAALAINSAYQKSVTPHPQRAAFFARLDSDESLCALIAEMLKLPFKMRVRRKLWKLKAVVKKVLNNEIGGG